MINQHVRAIAASLAALLCALSLGGCAERLPEFERETEGAYESRVMGFWQGTVGVYHDFAVDDMGNLYDAFSGEIRGDFCEDAACDGNCFLEAGYTSVNQICDGRVYFTQYYAAEDLYLYCDLELLTGRVEVLLRLPREESTSETHAWIENGYMYYMRTQLKEGGDSDNPTDYADCIFRIPLEGGESEMVYMARSVSESLQLVADNGVYTVDMGTIYRYDLTTGEQRALYNSVENGFRQSFGALQYVDGYLYMPAFPEGTATFLLAVLHVESGEWQLITEEPLASYAVTNDAVYFVLRQPHTVSAPEFEMQYSNVCAPTIYACDTDGGNVRHIWTDESGLYDFIYGFTVADGVFYGNVSHFDVESNAWSAPFFAEIRFDTGEILPALRVE
ncbi:MAG: hypothetical protein IJW40_09705 [Clostridia bacterium]|nr:hypothetical protein [Clostridia bacterium]